MNTAHAELLHAAMTFPEGDGVRMEAEYILKRLDALRKMMPMWHPEIIRLAAITPAGNGGAVDDAMVERALIFRAMEEDQAAWPDAYSADEQAMERKAMKKVLTAAMNTAVAPTSVTERMIDAAMPHLIGVAGSKVRPIGQFYPGHTADESEYANWKNFGRDRVRAALTAALAPAAADGGDALGAFIATELAADFASQAPPAPESYSGPLESDPSAAGEEAVLRALCEWYETHDRPLDDYHPENIARMRRALLAAQEAAK